MSLQNDFKFRTGLKQGAPSPDEGYLFIISFSFFNKKDTDFFLLKFNVSLFQNQ